VLRRKEGGTYVVERVFGEKTGKKGRIYRGVHTKAANSKEEAKGEHGGDDGQEGGKGGK